MKAGTGNQVRGDGRLEIALAILGQLGKRGGRMLRNTFKRLNNRRSEARTLRNESGSLPRIHGSGRVPKESGACS